MLAKLIKLSNQPFLIPFYHLVSDEENSFAKYLYPPRKVETFKRDLEVLLKYYTPVSLHEFIVLSESENQPKKPYFHLTFDDGLSNFHDTVAPILEAKKIPATIFVNTNFIDNKALFYRYKASLLIQKYEISNSEEKKMFYDFFEGSKKVKEHLLAINYKNRNQLDELALKLTYSFNDFLESEKPYLTTIQINDLIKRGFTIGAHSTNHPLYAGISLQEQIEQTIESVAFVKDKFGVSYKAFSFPFNDLGVEKTFFHEMKNGLDISFGTAGIKKDRFSTNFHRLSFELADSDIEKFLIKEYIKYFLKTALGKNTMPRN